MTPISPIIDFELNGIYFDAEHASLQLNQATNRHRRIVTGMVRANDHLLVICGRPNGNTPVMYRFAELSSSDPREMIGAVRSREIGGYLTLGTWEVNGEIWGLFYREASA